MEKKRSKAWVVFLLFIPLSVLLWLVSLLFFDTDIILPSTANANGKLLFTNTAVLCTEADSSGVSVPDGIYAGRLKYDTEPDDMYCNFSPDGINAALCYLMGDHSSSYYCVAVRDNTPVAAYWSAMPIPYDRAEDLIGSYEHGVQPFIGIMVIYTVSRPYSLGGYPNECFSDEDKIPSYGTSLPVYRTGSVPVTERIKFLPEEVGIINIYILLCLIYGAYLLIKARKHMTRRKER